MLSASYVNVIPTEISAGVWCEKLPVWTATYHNKLPIEQQTHTHNYAVLVEWPIVTLPFPSHCSLWSHAVCVCGLNGQWSVTDRQALTLWGPLCPPATLSSDRQRVSEREREAVTDRKKWFFFFFKLAACVPRLWIPLGRWERGGGGWIDKDSEGEVDRVS